jgi:hypothetical protein
LLTVELDMSAAARQDHPDSLPGSKALRLPIRESNERPDVQPYYQLLGGLRTDRVLKHAGIEGVHVAYERHFAHTFNGPRAGACGQGFAGVEIPRRVRLCEQAGLRWRKRKRATNIVLIVSKAVMFDALCFAAPIL